MKYISLLTHAYVMGVLCAPADGVLQVADDEAALLVKAGLATDVSGDFVPADLAPIPVAPVPAEPEQIPAAPLAQPDAPTPETPPEQA